MTNNTNTLITIEEASQLLGIATNVMLYGLTHERSFPEGTLPPHRQHGLELQWSEGCAYFDRDEVLHAVRQMEVK